MEFAITGYQLVVGLGIIGLVLTAMIIILRKYFNQKHIIQESRSWTSRTKYRAYDVFRHSGVFFRSGIIASLLLTLLAFNYTQYGNQAIVEAFNPDDDWIETITPPVTYPERKPIPIPPKSINSTLVIEAVQEIKQPEFVETIVKATVVLDSFTHVIEAGNVQATLLSPLPLPEVEDHADRLFLISERLPRMCIGTDDSDLTRIAKNDLAKKEMMQFIQAHLKYPIMAREIGIQGMCPVQFTVKSDGTVQDVKLLRDIGGGCGKEALRVTKLLQDQCWTAGRQNGQKVSVQMVLPIRFKLQE